MDEEDPVVEEFDIDLTQFDGHQLSMLQFPLRPRYRPYGDQGDLTEAAFKGVNHPDLAQLELSYDIHLDTPNYNANADRHRVTKQEFSSTNIPLKTNYCLGVLNSSSKRLNLVPLDSCLQMRPSFSHVDAELEKRKIQVPKDTEEPTQSAQLKQRVLTIEEQREMERKQEFETEEIKVLSINQSPFPNWLNPKTDKLEEAKLVDTNSFYKELIPDSYIEKHQEEITREREGTISIGEMSALPYDEFLEKLLSTSGVIGVVRFYEIIQAYTKDNSLEKKEFVDALKDATKYAYILANGLMVLKPNFRYNSQFEIYFRNLILSQLYLEKSPMTGSRLDEKEDMIAWEIVQKVAEGNTSNPVFKSFAQIVRDLTERRESGIELKSMNGRFLTTENLHEVLAEEKELLKKIKSDVSKDLKAARDFFSDQNDDERDEVIDEFVEKHQATVSEERRIVELIQAHLQKVRITHFTDLHNRLVSTFPSLGEGDLVQLITDQAIPYDQLSEEIIYVSTRLSRPEKEAVESIKANLVKHSDRELKIEEKIWETKGLNKKMLATLLEGLKARQVRGDWYLDKK